MRKSKNPKPLVLPEHWPKRWKDHFRSLPDTVVIPGRKTPDIVFRLMKTGPLQFTYVAKINHRVLHSKRLAPWNLFR